MEYSDPTIKQIIAEAMIAADDALVAQLGGDAPNLCPQRLIDEALYLPNSSESGLLDIVLYLQGVEDFLSGTAMVDMDFMLKDRDFVLRYYDLADMI